MAPARSRVLPTRITPTEIELIVYASFGSLFVRQHIACQRAAAAKLAGDEGLLNPETKHRLRMIVRSRLVVSTLDENA